MNLATPVRRAAVLLSRIGIRLLLFNVLLVFLPVAGVASLDAYESHLLDQQERAMVQLGRLFAASLSNAAVVDEAAAARALDQLGAIGDARLRLVLPDGRVVADTHRRPGASGPVADAGTSYTDATPSRRASSTPASSRKR